MTKLHYIGWARDSKGKVLSRPTKQISNAITTMSGRGRTGEDGLGNTTPCVIHEYD